MKTKSLNVFAVATILLAAATATQAQITNFFQAVTNLSPAAYWPLQENAQPPGADVETNLGSIGAIANAYYSSTNAIKNQAGVNSGGGDVAVRFIGGAGSGSFLGVPNTSHQISLPVGAFTVEAWIYPSNTAANQTIMGQAGLTTSPGLNGSVNGGGWTLNQNFDPYTGQVTPGWSFHVYNGQNYWGGADALVATNYATNTWYHLVGVFDGTNAYLYVDGLYASTASNAMPAGTSFVPDTWDFLQLGCGRGENANQFNGEIEEAAVYTSALSPALISQDFNAINSSSSFYQATVLSNNPVMYWRMNSPANNIAQPITAYPVAVSYGKVANVNGLYSSTATPGSPGPTYFGMTNGSFNVSGLACAFNGMGDDSTNQLNLFTNGVRTANYVINSGVVITNLPLVLNPITNSLSFMYWVKFNPIDDRRNAVFGHSDTSWRSSILGNQGTAVQVTANAGKGGDQTVNINLNDGNWHFVTFVYSNTFLPGPGVAGYTATNFLYIDGVLRSSVLNSNLTSSGSTTNILIGGAPDKNAFGNSGYNGNANGSQMLLGSVAHVAFFTNALTPAQVQTLYSAAGAPPSIQIQPSPSVFFSPAGTTNVFGAVTVSGASTLVYQWYYNTVSNYSGATALTEGQTASGSGDFGTTTSQLTVTNIGDADSGYYFVITTNNYGSVTSVISHLVVTGQAPVITAQNPTGPFTGYVNQNNLGISVTANGAGALTYHWYTNGVADTTAGTSANYPWTVKAGQAGTTFQCIVANLNGSATSAVATLTTVLTVPAAAGNGVFQADLLGLNPAAYWPLQETVPTPTAEIETNYGSLGAAGNAYYSSSNAMAGATGVTGDGDAAINFVGAGAGSFLAVPQTNGVSVPVGPFTVEAWIFPTNINSGANTIVSQTGPSGSGSITGSANSAGWSLNQNYIPSGNTTANLLGWSFHVFNGTGATGGAEAIAPNSISAGVWYHIVGVFDGTNCYLYVDGTNAGTAVSSINGAYVQDTWTPMTIGSGRGFNNNQFYGSIDEVAVYTNALTALQISNHYAQVSGSSYSSVVMGDHPYMYYRMDAPAYLTPANTAFPVAFNYGSAANMNGLYLLGTTPGVPGPTNAGMGATSYSCAFNGIGSTSTNNIGIFMPDSTYNTSLLFASNSVLSGILCTNDAPSLAMTNQPFTIACWFKANPSDPTRFQNMFGAHGDSGPRFAFSGGQVQFYVGTGGNIVSGTAINCQDGNWHFAVGVYTNSGSFASGVESLYVDGVQVASSTIATGESATLTNNAIMIGGDPTRIVSGGSAGYSQRFFAGSVAHMAYFTNALTPSQIVSLYTNATAGIPPAGPFITGQPVTGRTAGAGSNGGVGPGSFIFFGVIAQGTPPLSYQWYFNSSSNYAGATQLTDGAKYQFSQTSQVTVTNLATTDSGYYYCIITNNYGSATTILATLQVSLAPVITAQSPNGAFSLYPNQTATLSVTVGQGETPYSYFWFTNGVQDASVGGGSSTYSVSAGHPAVSGETYQCLVSNPVTTVTMVPGTLNTLTIVPLPASVTNSPYATNVIGLGASGYWPMHEIETQPLIGDLETNYGSWGTVGNGYYQDWAQATVVHNAAGALAGTTNSAVGFFNVTGGDALVIPHSTQLLTLGTSNFPAFSLEAWVKPFEAGAGEGSGTNMTIMGQGGGTNYLNGSANFAGFDLRYGGTADTFSLVVYNGVGGQNYEQRTANFYPPGQWYHIVALWSGSNVQYYINGQQASFLSGNPSSSDNPQTLNPDIVSPFTIGGGHWSASGSRFPFIGEIDEVAVYTNLLTQQQIQNDYAAGTTASSNYFQTVQGNSPVLYYRMDAPAYTEPAFSAMTATLTNYGSVPLNGVYVPSAVPGGAAGPGVGSALSTNLSGTNAMYGNGVMSFADAGINPLWNPTGTTSFSYSCWERGFPCDSRSLNEMFCANDGTWRSAVNNGGHFQIHGNIDVIPGNNVNDGNWHQFVMTAQGSLSNSFIGFTNTLYIDGVLAIQQWATNGGNNPAGSPGPEVTIGNEWGQTNPVANGGGRSFAGNVCEAAFFSGTVLTPAQVQSLYNSAGMAPNILSQPFSGIAVVTKAFTNSVSANGAQPLSYQWFTNGVAIGGSATNFFGEITNGVNTASLIINPVEPVDGCSYYVVVTNAYGAITSSVVNLTALGAPFFTNQIPVPYTNQYAVYAGANPNFSVNAIGAPTIAYYWSSNGVPIAGASASNFTYVNVQAAFTNINCIASNFLGTATSVVWSAFVVSDPTNSTGGLAPYPQSVLALNPIGYWRLNDTNLDTVDDGAGDNGYLCHDYISGNDGIFTNLSLGNVGYNPVTDPSETSAQFGQVNVNSDFGDSHAMNIAGINFGMPSGSNTAFTIEAWVKGYQQTSDAGLVTLGNGNAEQFNLDCGADGAPTSHGFRFNFRDAGGGVHTVASTVMPSTVPNSLGPWYHLVGVVDEVNSNQTFYINGVSVGSTALTGGLGVFSNTNLMTIGSRRGSATTNFNFQFLGNINDVAVYNYALSASNILSQYAGSGVAPFFTQAPTAATNASGGGSLVIPALVAGTGPVTNWWSDVSGGTNIVTASTNGNLLNATLTVTNVPGGWNNDQIELIVSNAFGGTNVFVSLSIFTNAPTVVIGIPGAVAVKVGQPYTYSPTVDGALPLGYQWYTNGVGLGGATSPTLTLADLTAGSTLINLVVTNIYGSASASSTLVVAASPTNSTYGAYVMGMNPIGYWPMHEVESASTGDIETNYGTLGALGNGYWSDWDADNGNPGTNLVQHGFTGALTGDTNPAVSLVGSVSSVLVVPHDSPLMTITPPYTLEAWVNAGTHQPATFGVFMGQGGGEGLSGGTNFAGFSFLWNGTPNTFSLTEFTGKGGLQFNGEPKTTAIYTSNTWYHMVATFDGTNVAIYVNGSQAALQNSSAASMAPDSWSPLCIGGGRWNGSGPADQWSGQIDEAAVYTNVLSAARIAQHYNAGQNPGTYGAYFTNVLADNPMLYYRMDSPVFTPPATNFLPSLLNFGSVGINGVYTPGTTPGIVPGPNHPNGAPVTGLPGTNVAALGISSFGDAGNNSAYNFVGSNAFSVIATFKGDPADSRFQNIVGHSDNSWRIALNVGGNLQCTLGSNGPSQLNSMGKYNDGNWHQVIEVYSPASNPALNGTNLLYVDGLLDNMNNGVSTNGIGPGSPLDVLLGADPQYTNSPTGPGRQLAGAVCEVALFTNALTAAQVQGLLLASGDVPPEIMGQPSNAGTNTAGAGTAVNFSVAAIGTPTLAYQWYFNTVSNYAGAMQLTDNVVNITNSGTATLTVTNLTTANTGFYFVTVTNAFGTTNSILASLTVVNNISFTNPPPISFTSTNNQLILSWPSNYVGYYYLQVQTNTLAGGIGNNWVPYGGSVAATLNSGGVTNTITGSGCAFYRLMTNAP